MDNKNDIIWRYIPHIYTTLEYLLSEEGRAKRMLRGHIESLAKWQGISNTFQEVEVPLAKAFQGYLAFHGIPTVLEVPNRHVNYLGAEILLLTHFFLLWGEK